MLFILLLIASKETKKKENKSQIEKLRCNSPFLCRHRAILYIVRTPGRGGLFLYFIFLTKNRYSHQWCTLVIMRQLFINDLTIYKKRCCVQSTPWLWTCFLGDSGWQLIQCQMRPFLNKVLLVGTELGAIKRFVFLNINEPCGRMHLTPHFYKLKKIESMYILIKNVWKHCRPPFCCTE